MAAWGCSSSKPACLTLHLHCVRVLCTSRFPCRAALGELSDRGLHDIFQVRFLPFLFLPLWSGM